MGLSGLTDNLIKGKEDITSSFFFFYDVQQLGKESALFIAYLFAHIKNKHYICIRISGALIPYI